MPMKAACLLLFCFAAFASALICESNVDCRNARNCKATCTSAGYENHAIFHSAGCVTQPYHPLALWEQNATQ